MCSIHPEFISMPVGWKTALRFINAVSNTLDASRISGNTAFDERIQAFLCISRKCREGKVGRVAVDDDVPLRGQAANIGERHGFAGLNRTRIPGLAKLIGEVQAPAGVPGSRNTGCSGLSRCASACA